MSQQSRSDFEQSLEEYQNRLSNIKTLANSSQRVVESNKPLEELKTVMGEIGNPLAVDFLREGILHHMGVVSAQIKKQGNQLRTGIQEQARDRINQLSGKDDDDDDFQDAPEEPAVPKNVPSDAPARNQISEQANIDSVENLDDLAPINARIATRYNNLDGEAQQRVGENVGSDPNYTPDYSSLEEGQANIKSWDRNISQEESNPETTFKDQNLKINPAEDYGADSGFAQTARQNPAKFPVESEISDADKAVTDVDKVVNVASDLDKGALIGAEAGAETGGLGFIAAGVLGIGAALGTIFAHDKRQAVSAPITTNYAAPVQSVGIR